MSFNKRWAEFIEARPELWTDPNFEAIARMSYAWALGDNQLYEAVLDTYGTTPNESRTRQ